MLSTQDYNPLYPIFLKAHNLQVVVIGGGFVAEEKLHFLLKSSPEANVTIVTPMIRPGTVALAKKSSATVIEDVYNEKYIEQAHIVIATTDSPEVNKQVYHDCRKRNKLVNVADVPELCDFYMGGIVTKGNVKIAISTNGQSPTMAKRLRQLFEEVLPENINDLVKNLNDYRKTLKDDFEYKVDHLNKLTETFLQD